MTMKKKVLLQFVTKFTLIKMIWASKSAVLDYDDEAAQVCSYFHYWNVHCFEFETAVLDYDDEAAQVCSYFHYWNVHCFEFETAMMMMMKLGLSVDDSGCF